ncbi:MAG: membrane protein insertase YidC [Myxococcota bacterium]
MDRNTTLAFALSMIVFVLYVMYQEDQRSQLPIEVSEEQHQAFESAGGREGIDEYEYRDTDEPTPAPAASRVAAADKPFKPANDIALRTLVLRNDSVIAEISNGPAMISGWSLIDYEEFVDEGSRPIKLVHENHSVLRTEISGIPGTTFADAHYEVVRQSAREIVQRAESAAGTLTRTLRLDENGYGFDLEVEFRNGRADPIDAGFEIVWPQEVTDREDFRELSLLAYGEEAGVTRTMIQGVGQTGMLSSLGFGGDVVDGVERVEGRSQWAGFDIQYFTGVVIDPRPSPRFRVTFSPVVKSESGEVRAALPNVTVSSGQAFSETLRGFIGPKTTEALANAGNGLNHSVNRGFSWLEPLTRFFEITLDKLYQYIPNYGLAIIVLTILVRICTAPLMAKQMRSAERMRELQPRMKELQERYKDDRQKQSEATMKLYREEKVNPVAGCLPLLLQFPVLIGLFYALRSSIGLRHAPFALWINDLSQPATLFVVPGIDFPIRLLPLVMGASMYVQQKMTPTTGMDPTQARMMLIMMPAMMLFISYTFPSGLVLYWTVSNLLGIAQQYWIRSQRQPTS